jgi:hypothetical protein
VIYNELMSSHFRGHPVVYEFEDRYRNRSVRVFDVARDGVLGVSDGIDAWMISRETSINGKQCASLNASTHKVRRHVLLIDQEEDSPRHVEQRRNPTPRVKLLV